MNDLILTRDSIEILKLLSKKELGNILSRFLIYIDSKNNDEQSTVGFYGLTKIEHIALGAILSLNDLQEQLKALENITGFGDENERKE